MFLEMLETFYGFRNTFRVRCCMVGEVLFDFAVFEYTTLPTKLIIKYYKCDRVQSAS